MLSAEYFCSENVLPQCRSTPASLAGQLEQQLGRR
jgi:hypothetical protein